MSRIYKVTLKAGSKTHARLVRANTKSGAIRHASIGTISADVVSQDDLVNLIGSGVKVEDSIESVPTAAAEEPAAKSPAKEAPAKEETPAGLKGAFAAE